MIGGSARMLVLVERARTRTTGQHFNAGLREVTRQRTVYRLRPACRQRNFCRPQVLQRCDMGFEIGVARQPGAFPGFGEYLPHPGAPECRRDGHAAQREPIDSLAREQIEPLPQTGQLLFHRRKAVLRQVEACGHQHHPFRSYSVELVRVEIGVEMGNDITELVPRADDAHRDSVLNV